MSERLLRDTQRTNLLLFAAVWLVTFVVYYMTTAPTLSFWDCGEFIASSYILGVPHPPGSPLYIIFGRLFSILPIASDIAVRINLLSGICSAFTAAFAYLIGRRLLARYFGADGTVLTSLYLHGGAVAGSLFVAFGITNWNNSVEAEVYGMAIMLMSIIMYLVLLYRDTPESGKSERIMLAIAYLGFLGIGVHMTIFLVIPLAAVFFVLKRDTPSVTWFAVAGYFLGELYLIFALSSRPGEVAFTVPVLIITVLYMFYLFSFEHIPRTLITIAVGLALSLIPLIASAINGVAARAMTTSAIGSGVVAALSVTGKIAFAATLAYAVYLGYRARSMRGGELRQHHLTAAGFLIVAGLMVLFVSLPMLKGYTAFLIVSAALTTALAVVLWRWVHWPVLVALVGCSAIVLGVREMAYGMIAAAVVILFLGLVLSLPRWKPALMILVVAVAGFSVHLFIPIRSAQQPSINENNPSRSLDTTIKYLERKQYGSESMIERMFKRRAEWGNQFGDYRRMGFWRFFMGQYGLKGPQFVPLFLLGLFGLWEVIRRSPRSGLLLFLLIVVSSIGLVLYMNFADGTRQHPITGADYIEVRDRDYFFTPAFCLFGLSIGLGIAAVAQHIRELSRQLLPRWRRVGVVASLAIFLLPVLPLAGNYYYCDRSRNYVPYDYGYNLLDSADPNAIIFTSGDNDTFPLWCLQEVYHVRTDVKVVNLSLANTDWYIKQIPSQMGVDLGWSDEQIDKLRPYRTSDGTVFRLQDQVIDAIINTHRGKRPIHFAVSTGSGARRYLGQRIDSSLEMTGLMWRVAQKGSPLRVDVESAYEFYTDPAHFRARGVNDSTIYLNETSSRLTKNYANGFLMVADSLKKAGDTVRALDIVESAIAKVPHAGDAAQFAAQVYAAQGRPDNISRLFGRYSESQNKFLKVMAGRAYRNRGDFQSAEKTIYGVLREDPSYRPAFEELLRMFFANREPQKMRLLFEHWLQFNKNDRRVREMLTEMRGGSPSGDSSRSGRL